LAAFFAGFGLAGAVAAGALLSCAHEGEPAKMPKASASGTTAMAFAAIARWEGMRHVMLATSGRLTGPLADAVQ
jgi:hypothetical protein